LILPVIFYLFCYLYIVVFTQILSGTGGLLCADLLLRNYSLTNSLRFEMNSRWSWTELCHLALNLRCTTLWNFIVQLYNFSFMYRVDQKKLAMLLLQLLCLLPTNFH